MTSTPSTSATSSSCATCGGRYVEGDPVTVTATANSDSDFTAFTGCTGSVTPSGGSCTFTSTADTTVNANFSLAPQLTVEKVGTGTVTGPGIDCGTDCTQRYTTGTSVTVTAGSGFSSWSGCDSTSGASCTVTMNGNKTVTATFGATLTVTTSGPGAVSSDPAGISCPGDCTEAYALNTTVTLSAAATAPSCSFSGWTGACASDPDATCDVTMDSDKSVEALFSCIRLRRSDEETTPAGPAISWNSDLEVAGATGQVVLNGREARAVAFGRTHLVAEGRTGENQIEAQIVGGGDPGTWRFEFAGTVEPGSFRVTQGDVALITADMIAFRLRGAAGERVVFTFRPKP